MLTHNKAHLTFAFNRRDCGDGTVTGGWVKPMAAIGVGDTRKALDHAPAECEVAGILPGAVVLEDYANSGR